MNRLRMNVAVILSLATFVAARQTSNSQTSTNVTADPQTQELNQAPTMHVEVVSRTLKAVNFRHRGGSTKLDFRGTELMPQATGSATVESKTGRLEIKASFEHVDYASKFGLEYLTYVLWAVTPEGRATNLGEVLLDGGKASLHVTTDLQAFGMMVTAEPYFAVTQPSDLVVVENILRADTLGREEAINARYEVLPRGVYASSLEPIKDAVYGIDRKAPLDLFEARNAVRIARAAQADKYAASSFQKAEQLLAQAEDYYRRKQGKTPIGTVARDAAQTAEEARVMAIKHRTEEQAEQERQAAAEREIKAKAETEAETQKRQQAETERTQAEAEKAQAEKAKQEAEQAAQRSAQEREQAETARAAALAQQQALQAEAEKSRLAAQESERARQQSETEKAEMRSRLLQQLNTILQTRDTARGLIANMSDVLFEIGRYQLRPVARERLAKVSGIVLAYPDLRLEVDGYTDSIGSDQYNQQLSLKRAEAVRDYLLQQGVPETSIVARGLGKDNAIASNTTAAGRQQNRRVELVVSGEVIGTKVGANQSTTMPAENPQR
jgi:outer membrane protein OmpA-like peptidoglycan-associated protein